jgi:hypothetical protein
VPVLELKRPSTILTDVSQTSRRLVMAKNRMDVSSFIGKLLEDDDIDLLREGVRVLAPASMDTEATNATVPLRSVGCAGWLPSVEVPA